MFAIVVNPLISANATVIYFFCSPKVLKLPFGFFNNSSIIYGFIYFENAFLIIFFSFCAKSSLYKILPNPNNTTPNAIGINSTIV